MGEIRVISSSKNDTSDPAILDIPLVIRILKLSNLWLGQLLNGRSHLNSWCCWYVSDLNASKRQEASGKWLVHRAESTLPTGV